MVGDEVRAVGKAPIIEDLVDHGESLDFFLKCREKTPKHSCCVDCRREGRWHGDSCTQQMVVVMWR